MSPAPKTIPSVVFKAGTFEYLLVCVPGGTLLILYFGILLRNPQWSNFEAVFIILGVMGFLFLWFASFQLEVTPITVSYATLFTRKQSLLIDDLARVEIITGDKPPYCMLFQPRENCGARAIAINIKPLKKADLRKLALFLPKVAPQVQYDRRFLMMAEGKMPSMFFNHQ